MHSPVLKKRYRGPFNVNVAQGILETRPLETPPPAEPTSTLWQTNFPWGGYRGERVGEAKNPGPPKGQSPSQSQSQSQGKAKRLNAEEVRKCLEAELTCAKCKYVKSGREPGQCGRYSCHKGPGCWLSGLTGKGDPFAYQATAASTDKGVSASASPAL